MPSLFDIEMINKCLKFENNEKDKNITDIKNKPFTITAKDIIETGGDILSNAIDINPVLALFGDEICTIIAIMAFRLEEKGEK